MGQQSCTDAQGRVAGTDPFGLGDKVLEQGAGALTLVFFLDCASVEQGLAQDPAIIGADQVAFDQHLGIGVAEIRLRANFSGSMPA